MAVKITMNGNEMEVIADPHSFYTILNVDPGEDLLGEDKEIAINGGKNRMYGRVITGTIYVNDRATDGQIIYVGTFPKTVIGWKQLSDLGLIQANTYSGFVVDVPPVLIQGNRNPDYFHQITLNNHLKDDARRVIASWVRKGLIERCDSVCNAPISLGIKSNGKVNIRFYFHDLNEYSVREPTHPRLHISRAAEAITLGNYYSVLNLFYAEWQIPLDTYTKYKTAFTFLGKQYVWNRLPGKYKNTASRLSDALEKVLDKLPQNLRKRMTYYTDAILLSAETKKECEEFTDKLCHHLTDNSFEIRQIQSQAKPKVQFLKKEITKNGIRLGKEVIQKVKDMKFPPDMKELESVLKSLTAASQYIPGFGILSKSLFQLTSNKCKFYWDGKSKAALERLKDQVLVNRFVVPGLAENEECTVQILVKDGAWVAQILNRVKKPYRFASGVLKATKKTDSFANQELKAMKEVWSKHKRVLESRDVEWEVESPEIVDYKDNPESVPRGGVRNLDFLKTQGCKITVVPPNVRKPPTPWP